MTNFLILACLPCLVSGWWWQSNPAWDGFKVTWGMNIFNSYILDHQPRTVADAESEGFKKISDCDANDVFQGARYVKDNDYALVLLYDINGYIAGIQAGVPKGSPGGFPFLKQRLLFIENDDHDFITVYFSDPATTCTQGRTQKMFETEGTGTRMIIQTSRDSTKDYITIPYKEIDIAETKWTEGKCFVSMGKHYWYNLRKDMTVDEFFPVFLLYNRGKLTGFGWAFPVNLKSNRYEHPDKSVFSMFMKEVPDFLKTIGTISTMHVFMTNSPFTTSFC